MNKALQVSVLTMVMTVVSSAAFAVGPYGVKLTADDCDDGSGNPGIATPCTSAGVTNVVDAVNYLFSNAGMISPYTSNSSLDTIQVTGSHDYFGDLSPVPGTQATLAYISISAGGTNTPGIYPFQDPGTVEFFANPFSGESIFAGDGTMPNPYPAVQNPFNDNFGVLIDHVGDPNDPQDMDQVYYSDPAFNDFGADLMLAFDLSELDGYSIWIDLDGDGLADEEVTLTDTYVLAFEDINPKDPNLLSDEDYNDSIFLLTSVRPRDPRGVPEPATMALMGMGLAGLVGLRRRA